MENLWRDICNFASGLIKLGHDLDSRAAIFSDTRAEWFIALQVVFFHSYFDIINIFFYFSSPLRAFLFLLWFSFMDVGDAKIVFLVQGCFRQSITVVLYFIVNYKDYKQS
jgi:hypothetical protein